MRKLLPILLGIVLVTSCGDDDDGGSGVTVVPPRPLSEVALEDDAEIREYLETHFYNYEDFQEPIDPNFDFKVVIGALEGENANKTPLIDQVETVTINVSSFEFSLEEEENDVPHKLYYLNARQGTGGDPSVADSVFVNYQGRLLDGSTFDGVDSGVWFDLARIQAPLQGARGFSEGASLINGGTIPANQPDDGTFVVDGFGVGVIFMPSGLGYYNSPPSGPIDAYTPLVFEIDVLTMNEADHDGDGIPSIQEDLNGNGYLYDDNTDETMERDVPGGTLFSNLLDLDDDGDGILTRTEISDKDGNIIFPYPITGGGSVPDYLNPDVLRDPNN